MEEPEQKQSTIGNLSVQEIQKDILFFKDEVLRDMRKLELQMKGRVEKNINELEKKVIINETQSNVLNNKLDALTSQISSSSTKADKIDKMSALQAKLEEKIINNEVKLNSAVRDLSDFCFKYDKIFISNLFVPGFIGDHCKFPNLKEYIQWLNTQVSAFNTFKDKQLMDLKSYKGKLDGSIETFQNSIERIKGNFIDYCNQCVIDCETRFNQRIAVTEGLIEHLRTENSTHALMLKNEANKCKVDWEKMEKIKEEIYTKMSQEVEEFKTSGRKNIEGCSSFQREFQLMKSKFTELSEFIRDVRFRRGMEVKRLEYWEMSKKMNFNLKKNNNFSPGEAIKAEDTPSILQTTTNINYKNTANVFKRRENHFPTEIIKNKIEFKETNEEKVDPIGKVKTIKFLDKKTSQLKNKMITQAKESNKPKTILLKKNEGAKKISIDKSLTDFNITPNEDIKDLSSVPLTPLSSSNKANPLFVKTNQMLSSSPIKLNETRDNIEAISHRENMQVNLTRKRDSSNLLLRDQRNVIAIKKQSSPKKESKGNALNILISDRTLTPNTNSIDHPVITKNTSDNAPSKTKEANEFGNNSKDFLCSPRQSHCPKKREIEQNVKAGSKSKDDKVSSVKLSRKFIEIESRLGEIEHSSKKKLELIFLQLKKFIDQFDEVNHGRENNIKYLHSGFFVPMSFDDKNSLNYYPDNRNQRIVNQSKSQILKKKTKSE